MLDLSYDAKLRDAFHAGKCEYAHHFMGAHPRTHGDTRGFAFHVWAPQARKVSVVGDFNGWDPEKDSMQRGERGVWSIFLALNEGENYKYAILTNEMQWILKADPYAFRAQKRPDTASITYDLSGYAWKDKAFIEKRASQNPYCSPMNIYEVHAASWRQKLGYDPDEDIAGDRFLSYMDLAHDLIPYIKEMGYTHLQLMPMAEHPLDMSWGYQTTGYFAPTSRYGTPKEFMQFVDLCHQADIGVILDWVPGHFTRDAFGLRRFDGSALYESADSRKGDHPQWGTHIFNFARHEVESFLVSNAMYWCEMYHIDGLRVDAVTSMIYLDFGREAGQWEPNRYGGRENLEAIAFLRHVNEAVYRDFAGVMVMAEESSSYPMVTKPTYIGGLGFGFKWNMGWMNDILAYIKLDPIYRKYHHNKLTFSLMYAFSENYVLPFSHDEVVHGKCSLIERQPGDYWRKFAGLRALFGYMFAHPGKKLMFMGCEFGQFIEWKYAESLDWHLLDVPMHKKMQAFVRDLNFLYKNTSPLWEIEDSWEGFSWINPNDSDNSVLSFYRKDEQGEMIIVVVNFTPQYFPAYRLGVPRPGAVYEVFNSDHAKYGGSGKGNPAPVHSQEIFWDNCVDSVSIVVPPLAAIYCKIIPDVKTIKSREIAKGEYSIQSVKAEQVS